MRTRIPVGAFILLLSTGVFADDRDDDENDSPGLLLAVGASVSVEQTLYVGGDDSVEVLPRLFVQMGRFYLRGPALGVYLYGGDDLNVSTGIVVTLVFLGLFSVVYWTYAAGAPISAAESVS